MHEKAASGRTEKRVPLHTVVPLKVPFTAAISPSELCNFRCIYCNWGTPVGIPGAKILSWDDFVNIANHVKQLYEKAGVKCKNIRLSGNGEPLLNSRIAEMVKYIHDFDFSERIEITTNASLLTKELTEALLNAGLTRLSISLQGLSSEKYKKVCGKDIDFDKFLAEIKYFYDSAQGADGRCKVHIKTLDVAISTNEHSRFYHMFENICDTMNIENVMDSCADVDYESLFPEFERERTRYGIPFVERKCCDTLFFLINILPNGNVNCCGCKWPPHVIGNVFESHLHDIWNCGLHRSDMIAHAKGLRRTLPDCKTCSSILQYTMPEDNLDEHLEEILQRFL
jgi:MoaA/NifB/PqqE/SkfB family radical SAM enzyme